MYFEITTMKEREYSHCTVHIWVSGDFPSTYETQHAIEINWQTDEGRDYWYGGLLRVEANNGDKFTRKAKLAQKIAPLLFQNGVYDIGQPAEFIQAIVDKFKAVQVTRDSRLDTYVPLNKVVHPDWLRWVDNPDAWGGRYCTYSVLAPNCDEARKLILKEATENMNTEFIKLFIDNKMPVYTPSFQRAPDARPWQEILNMQETEENGHGHAL